MNSDENQPAHFSTAHLGLPPTGARIAEGPVIGWSAGTTTVHGLTVVSLAGHLDVATVPELRRQLAPCPSASLPDLAVDLSEVDFMDCTVVGAMVAARNRVADAGGCVRLSGPRRTPRRILFLCRLEEVFCIHDSLSEATAAVCARHRGRRATPLTPQSRMPPTYRPAGRKLRREPRGRLRLTL